MKDSGGRKALPETLPQRKDSKSGSESRGGKTLSMVPKGRRLNSMITAKKGGEDIGGVQRCREGAGKKEGCGPGQASLPASSSERVIS